MLYFYRGKMNTNPPETAVYVLTELEQSSEMQ